MYVNNEWNIMCDLARTQNLCLTAPFVFWIDSRCRFLFSLRFLNMYGAKAKVQADDDDNAMENASLLDDEWTDNEVRIFFRRTRILHFYVISYTECNGLH